MTDSESRRDAIRQDILDRCTSRRDVDAYEECYPDRMPRESFRMIAECLRLPGCQDAVERITALGPLAQSLNARELYDRCYPDAVEFHEFRDIFLAMRGRGKGKHTPAEE